jgi:hypothetical protein
MSIKNTIDMDQEELNDFLTHELLIVIARLRHVRNNLDSISMRHECNSQLEAVLSKLNCLIEIFKE